MPLILMGLKPGTLADEKRLHEEFSHFRKHLEWFDLPEAQVWKLAALMGRELPEGVDIAA